jgi:hypothetical protein
MTTQKNENKEEEGGFFASIGKWLSSFFQSKQVIQLPSKNLKFGGLMGHAMHNARHHEAEGETVDTTEGAETDATPET